MSAILFVAPLEFQDCCYIDLRFFCFFTAVSEAYWLICNFYLFFSFIYETERHNGIAELLEILGRFVQTVLLIFC
jgi:hypothetical protein